MNGRQIKEQQYTQGRYVAKNPKKYTGSQPILYRSRPEYLIMRWMDNNPNVLSWASETDVVWYQKSLDKGRSHRYFLDFTCEYKNKDDSVTKLFIEYKPKKFLKKPEKTKRMSTKTYNYLCETWITNQEKWAAAKQYAEAHKGKFMVICEDSIGIAEAH